MCVIGLSTVQSVVTREIKTKSDDRSARVRLCLITSMISNGNRTEWSTI